MIAYLRGKVRKKGERSIIIEIDASAVPSAGSVGYLVHVPTPLLDKVAEKEDIELFVETRVREDDISLYGFETWDQQELFKSVTSISGIGAKIGLELLSHDPEKIKSAIIGKDADYLSKIHGVGKKTAERLIVELKGKTNWDVQLSPHRGLEREENNDAVSALLQLGYQKYEIREILRDMPANITEPEAVVTYFLQNI